MQATSEQSALSFTVVYDLQSSWYADRLKTQNTIWEVSFELLLYCGALAAPIQQGAAVCSSRRPLKQGSQFTHFIF